MSATAKKPFRLNGWHVLAMMVLFFATISAVNAVMITLAVKSFPGEQQKKSYMQGLQYNEVIEARRAQEQLGWEVVMMDGNTLPSGETAIRLQITDASGIAVRGLAIEGMIGRPATDRLDREVAFVEAGDGVYTAVLSDLEEGNWTLAAQGTDGAGNTLSMEKRLWLK